MIASNIINLKQFKIAIGIDTGVKTGTAIWNRDLKNLTYVDTVQIDLAMEIVSALLFSEGKDNVFVKVEDARMRKKYGKNAYRNDVLQGVGSVKRDSKIWEDFLTRIKANYKMVSPSAGKTKLCDAAFKRLTGYEKRTSNHSRDAAMLVYKLL